MSTTTVILVPRRPDHGIRDRIWQHLHHEWAKHGYEIIEGHHDTYEGPFNRARAINRAARHAGDWDLALILDSDVWVPPANLEKARQAALDTGKLSYPHTAWWCTSEDARDDILGGTLHLDDWDTWPDGAWSTRTPLSQSSLMWVRRDLYDEVGGYDERFIGWGAEDWGWHKACTTLRDGEERIDAPVVHLHHPVCEESRAANASEPNKLHDANVERGKQYLRAAGNKKAIHKLIREARQARER